jgi:predicted regulator of Ras-like GTPase activity (Roadblock/LC7/MglB family)
MNVSTPSGEHGLLYFHEGVLHDALFNDLKSEEAVYAILALDDVKIGFRSLPDKRFKKKIKSDLTTILMKGIENRNKLNKIQKEEIIPLESQIRTDEEFVAEAANEPIFDVEVNPPQENSDLTGVSKGNSTMKEIHKVLEKIKGIGGFMGVGAFSPNGEMMAEVNGSGVKLQEMGAIANDVLLKAQKATEMMHVGRGQLVHVEAPKAHIICRCLNEATDFAVTSSGRAHVHMVLVLDKEEGNVALGKMKMESIIYEVAEYFR